MLKDWRIIQDSARRIADAANHTLDDYAVARVEQEPEFTGEMLGRMKEAMHGYVARGVRWTAKILTSLSPNAQESKFGADFIGVVEFDLPEYRVTKGFLAQAKRIERGQRITPSDWNRMVQQCKQMLSITTESFVYAKPGIVVVPALAIASATTHCNPHDFYSRTAERFYKDHFECFVGDQSLSSPEINMLVRLKARNALFLAASPVQQTLPLQPPADSPF
jgi:hypothetical protein